MQGSLQADFDQVQALFEERSASLLKVQQELADAENTVGSRYEKALDELKQLLEDERRRGKGLDDELRRARDTLAESAFNERDEEIFSLKEEHVLISYFSTVLYIYILYSCSYMKLINTFGIYYSLSTCFRSQERSRIRISELETELESLRLVLDSPTQIENCFAANHSSSHAATPPTATPPPPPSPKEQQMTDLSKEREGEGQQVPSESESDRLREALAQADVERAALLERVRTLEAEKQQIVSGVMAPTTSAALDLLNQSFLSQLDSSKAQCDKLQAELDSVCFQYFHESNSQNFHIFSCKCCASNL